MQLFALGIIIFFGQRYVLGYFIITWMFLPAESGFYGIISQSYYMIYTMSEILIIAGVVVFFKGCKETNNPTSSSTSSTAEG